jgi:hypothetical protein
VLKYVFRKGRFEKSKKSIFSIEESHISHIFVLNKLINGQHLKYKVLIQSLLVLRNFHINAKNWSKIATFQNDLKKKQSNFLSKFYLFM